VSTCPAQSSPRLRPFRRRDCVISCVRVRVTSTQPSVVASKGRTNERKQAAVGVALLRFASRNERHDAYHGCRHRTHHQRRRCRCRSTGRPLFGGGHNTGGKPRPWARIITIIIIINQQEQPQQTTRITRPPRTGPSSSVSIESNDLARTKEQTWRPGPGERGMMQSLPCRKRKKSFSNFPAPTTSVRAGFSGYGKIKKTTGEATGDCKAAASVWNATSLSGNSHRLAAAGWVRACPDAGLPLTPLGACLPRCWPAADHFACPDPRG
jgi:hypothetical protein